MILKLVLFTSSLLGPIVAVNSVCNNTLRFSDCQRNNNIYANATSVYSSSTVNCSFAGSLCCYRQGCFDFNMEQWQTTNGHASVRQTSAGCGTNAYSVLESPWVNFSSPSCVEFTYSRRRPYKLQVFLAFSNGTQPSMMEDSQNITDNKNRTARFDFEHLTGKIQFRVRGGGGVIVSSPRLYYVRITEGRCQNNAVPQHSESSDPSTCDLITTTPRPPLDKHTTSSNTTQLNPSSNDASTSSHPLATDRSSSDMSTGSLVAVIVSVIVGVVVVVVVIVLIVRRRRRTQRGQKPEGSDSDGNQGQAVYENQGFHDQPARHPVEDSFRVNPRDMSDPRDPARPSNSIDDYLMPMNVYDGLANRNIEQNPYDALANQNNTYEGLSQNRNENRTYDSLAVSRGQSEDYEIPDTTS